VPVYEFRCPWCQKKFEKLCRLGETGEHLACPECEIPGAVRIVSGFSSPGTEGGKGDACGPCTKSSCAGCR